MGDDELLDKDGGVHEKGWDGTYRPKERLFGQETDRGLLGPNIKKSISGDVEARDVFGQQKKSSDGSPLYVPKGSSGNDAFDDAAVALGGGILVVALVAIAAVVVGFVMAIAWWIPRLVKAVERDVAERRLSWTTIGLGIPIILIVAALGSSLLNSRSGYEGVPATVGQAPLQPSPGEVLALDGTSNIDGLNMGITVPANTCDGFAFGLRLANSTSGAIGVHYSVDGDVWGGVAVDAGCYANTISSDDIRVAANATTTIGFRDLHEGPTVLTVTVDGRAVQWRLTHSLATVPSDGAVVYKLGESAKTTDVKMTVISEKPNTCGGFAFGLRLTNSTAQSVTIRYSFEREVWGGEDVRSGCYPISLTDGSTVAPAGKTVVVGFRDLASGPTKMAVAVETDDPIIWSLRHP
jgi:hypothetical protein